MNVPPALALSVIGYRSIGDREENAGLRIAGASKGLNAETMPQVYEQVLTWTRAGELTFDLEKVPLGDIETAWQRTDLRGKRLVIVPNA
jgi:hypothetical protein